MTLRDPGTGRVAGAERSDAPVRRPSSIRPSHPPRVLHDFGQGRGIDGMTVTTDGRIVATAGTGEKAGVYVFTRAGNTLGFIPVPEPPTNVEFGGPANKILYITAGKSLYRIETLMIGYHLWPHR